MAYSSTNPPQLIAQTYGDGIGVWVYKSTHTAAAVAASSFISDGYSRDMGVGDVFRNVEVTTAGVFTGFADGCVTAVTSGAGATVSFAATSTS